MPNQIETSGDFYVVSTEDGDRLVLFSERSDAVLSIIDEGAGDPSVLDQMSLFRVSINENGEFTRRQIDWREIASDLVAEWPEVSGGEADD